METKRQALREFLQKHAKKPELVSPAMDVLEPFFVIAETGRYPLATASAINSDEMAKAISRAIGKPVKKVVLVSMSHPFPQPEWMTDDAYRKSFGTSHEVNLEASLLTSLEVNPRTNREVSLWCILKDSFNIDLRASFVDSFDEASLNEASLAVNLETGLEDILKDSLEDNLWVSLLASLKDNPWVSLKESIVYGESLVNRLCISLKDSLFHYLGYTLFGDEATAAKFIPLLSFLHRTFPLGEKKDEPGTWIVLVA